MKIALSQLNYLIGDLEGNTEKIIKAIDNARRKEADLVVFSELAITGYSPRDLLEFDGFLNQTNNAIDEIALHTNNIGVIIGAPVKNHHPKGKPLYNAGLFIYQNKVQSIHPKALLPNYDIFDEYRYFESGTNKSLIEFKGYRIALTVCEDIWNLTDHPLYTNCPMENLKDKGVDLMINIAASPFDVNQHQNRLEILRNNAKKYKLPLFM